MFESIDRYVRHCIDVTDAELNLFHGYLQHKEAPKKTILLRAGEVCDFEAFVLKGCARVYFVNDSGKEVDVYFPVEDWWMSDLPSFTFQTPAALTIETIEPCELLLINHADKEKLFREVPKFERMFRLMVQRAYEEMMNRFISSVAQPADERYRELLKKYPSLPNRVPQHLIAAYLGISAEFLSKIRSKHK